MKLKEILAGLLHILQSADPLEELVSVLKNQPALIAVVFWMAAFAAGIVSVLYADLFHLCSEVAMRAVTHHPYLFILVAPFLFLLSWWLVARFAPPAVGSGIPQVMAAIEADATHTERWVGARISAVKVGSSLACLLGGGAIGREGPTVQIAASLFYLLGMPFRRIWAQIGHSSLLIAGGAAGIAAAFNTPLGGIVFAIEELSHQHISKFRTFLISAVIIAGLVSQWMLGPYLFFGGYPRMPAAGIDSLPWALACGLLGGLGGGIFGWLLYEMQLGLSRWSTKERAAFAMLTGLTLACAGHFLDPDILGGGTEFISKLLLTNEKQVSWWLPVGRFVGPLFSSLAGCAGGIFAPSLAAGAALGAKLALLGKPANANLILVLTMISFMAGVTRAPFTAFVLVLEMTDRHSAIFPMMGSALVGSVAALAIDSRGYYARRADRYLQDAGIAPAPSH